MTKANLFYSEWNDGMNFHRFNLQIYDMQCSLDIVVNWFCVWVWVCVDSRGQIYYVVGKVSSFHSEGFRCNGNSSLRRYLLYSCAIAVKVITVEQQQQKNGRFSWKSPLSSGLLTLINKHKRKSSRRKGAKERDRWRQKPYGNLLQSFVRQLKMNFGCHAVQCNFKYRTS